MKLNTILAGVCAVMFVVTGVAALLLFNIEWKAFTSAAYKQAFEKRNLYERTPAILANALYSTVLERQGIDPYLRSLTVGDWETTIASLLPPEEIKAITDHTLDSVFDYINGKTDSVVVSLLPLKSRLLGPAGVEVAMQILRAQPDCTLEQLMQMGLGLASGEINLCNPPGEMLGLVTPLIESQLQVMVTAFPDEIRLNPDAQNGTSQDPRLRLDRIRTLMKFSPVVPLLLLIGLTAFGVRSLGDWLKWWGYPFIATGAVGALIALIGSPILGWLIERVIQFQGAGLMPPILLSAMRETVGAVAGQILLPVVYEGLILAGVGMGMIVVAIVLRQRGK